MILGCLCWWHWNIYEEGTYNNEEKLDNHEVEAEDACDTNMEANRLHVEQTNSWTKFISEDNTDVKWWVYKSEKSLITTRIFCVIILFLFF